MSDMTPEEVRHHVKSYVSVFVALMVLTVVTVAVSYLHLTIWLAVIVALIIATVKGSLVAAVFMHLIAEKRLIYYALVLTVVFFVFLMFLPLAEQTLRVGERRDVPVARPAAPAH